MCAERPRARKGDRDSRLRSTPRRSVRLRRRTHASAGRRRSPLRIVDVETLPVIDDWPEKVPITEEEVEIFERYFGDVLDRLFGPIDDPDNQGLPSYHQMITKAMSEDRDPSLDTLLDLDGQVLVVDPEGGHWVKFIVTRIPASPEKPHGLDYSLTLHGPSGERLVGFDNAHPVGRGRRGEPMDHRHRLQTVKPYAYEDAATLLADFWQAVDAVLKERGVL
jgi:hypothetical protein